MRTSALAQHPKDRLQCCWVHVCLELPQPGCVFRDELDLEDLCCGMVDSDITQNCVAIVGHNKYLCYLMSFSGLQDFGKCKMSIRWCFDVAKSLIKN